MKPFYENGLDAVLVQDLGALSFIREHFPDLALHASTQMSVAGASGAGFLKKYGVERIVPARELSLSEIRKMKEETGLEIECFVHGALCYSYSGQCLFSSMLGGRSGNRGQCAQPCRLKYQVEGMKKPSCILSLKDIMALDDIPDLIEAGVDSFKIEGRMKKPEYVSETARMYRKYADLFLEKGRLCPRRALLFLFRTVPVQQHARWAERQPGTVRAAVPSEISGGRNEEAILHSEPEGYHGSG